MEETSISSPSLKILLEKMKTQPDFESQILLSLRELDEMLPPLVSSKRKQPKESLELRRQADQLVVKQRQRNRILLEAREIYSKSIAHAESNSIELAQAYANRSSSLFYLHKIEECIRDIDRALKLPYPDHLRPNLLRRKAKCLNLLGNKEADQVCEEARCLLEDMSLDDVKKEKLENAIDKAAKVAEQSQYKYLKHELPSFVPHDSIPSASEAIDLVYNENVGRHFVAKRDIAPGEVLIAEKPYVINLKPENEYTHCSHCFLRTWDSIPCEHCTHAMYCSQKCKDEAWKSYHDVECFLKEYFIGVNLSENGPLCLRLTMLAVREFGSIDKLKKEVDEIDNCKDYLMKSYSEDGIFHSDQYRPIYNLLTHETKRDNYEILVLTFHTAVVLYYINMYTDFFGTDDKSISALCTNKDVLFFGKLFQQNYMRSHINGHEFGELVSTQFVNIGAIIGCATSLLNHSCNPNAFRTPVIKNNTVHLVIYSLRLISKGSPILDDYGCHFMVTSKTGREEFLKPYYFECKCDACEKNWPLLQDLPSIVTHIDDKELKVTIARSIIRSLKFKKPICYDGFDDDVENITEIIDQLSNTITLTTEAVKKPSKEYYELLELFRLAFTKFYGNKFEL